MTSIIRRNSFTPAFGSTLGGFDRFFDDLFAFGTPTTNRLSTTTTDCRVKETDETWQISVPAPGISKKDCSVSVKDSGARSVLIVGFDNTSDDEAFVQSFRRSWTLPVGATSDSIGAQFRNGVLTVTVQKPDKATASDEVTITVK